MSSVQYGDVSRERMIRAVEEVRQRLMRATAALENALLRMKLTSVRDKDRVHLRDLIDVGLVDAGWKPRLASQLAARLQQLLDNPEG